MNKALLGIDLGTSSIKVLLYHPNGHIEKTKVAYEEISPSGWLNAMKKALRLLDLAEVGAVGLSSQTGTYVVNGERVIAWSDPAGKAELAAIRDTFSRETFLSQIGMPHPAIASYPLPRLCYIKSRFKSVQTVCQPKDLMLTFLTGVYKSDVWTWRGLAHPETGKYSEALLSALGLDLKWLPTLVGAEDVAGTVTKQASLETGLPAGTPVVTGLNDFFAGLVGMGVPTLSPLFDITGTSEHFGTVTGNFAKDTEMVSGQFLTDFVHYGGTASSGTSLTFALRELGAPSGEISTYLAKDPPIFLPYLNGERAPVFDPHARGVFFGLDKDTKKEEMAYAVLEGVAFSIYHIARHLGALPAGEILLGGGAACDPLLGAIKATLFDRPFVTLCESDTSALGAAMIAGLGTECFEDLAAAVAACVRRQSTYHPAPEWRDKLLRRFAVYEKLYRSIKPLFEEWKEIS